MDVMEFAIRHDFADSDAIRHFVISVFSDDDIIVFSDFGHMLDDIFGVEWTSLHRKYNKKIYNSCLLGLADMFQRAIFVPFAGGSDGALDASTVKDVGTDSFSSAAAFQNFFVWL